MESKNKTPKKIGKTNIIIECDVIEHKEDYEIVLPSFINITKARQLLVYDRPQAKQKVIIYLK